MSPHEGDANKGTTCRRHAVLASPSLYLAFPPPLPTPPTLLSKFNGSTTEEQQPNPPFPIGSEMRAPTGLCLPPGGLLHARQS